MHSVDLPDDLYKRLERLATGFTTPVAVIAQAVDALEGIKPAAQTQDSSVQNGHSSGLATFEALHPPNLTHTKVVAASFDGVPVRPNNWKRLLEAAIVYAYKKNPDFDKVRNLAAVNMAKGKKED